MFAAVAAPAVFVVAAAVDATPALKVREQVRSLLPLRGTAWSMRSIGRRSAWMDMTAVMEPRWPVAMQIGLRGGLPVLVGAPSCPGVGDGLSATNSS